MMMMDMFSGMLPHAVLHLLLHFVNMGSVHKPLDDRMVMQAGIHILDSSAVRCLCHLPLLHRLVLKPSAQHDFAGGSATRRI